MDGRAVKPNSDERTRVFIGGTGRSGTSVMKSVLSEHPAITACAGELRIHLVSGGLLDLRDDLSIHWSRTRGSAAIWAFWNLCRRRTREADTFGSRVVDLSRRILGFTRLRSSATLPKRQFPLDRCFGTGFLDECDRFLRQFGYAFQPNIHPDTPFYRGFFETSPQSTEEMDRRCGKFLDRLYARIGEGSIWCDDTPLNMNHVESLSRFFPDQSLVFVHVLRNPLDTVSSFIKHPASWTSEDFRTSLNWLESTVTKIAHETGHGTAEIYNVRLEDLVENPEEIMTDLFWSLGVEFDARQTKTDLTRDNYGRSAKELSPQERKEVWNSVGWFYEPFGYSFEGDKVVAT